MQVAVLFNLILIATFSKLENYLRATLLYFGYSSFNSTRELSFCRLLLMI